MVRLGVVMVVVVAEGTEAARGSGTTTMILEEDEKTSGTSSKMSMCAIKVIPETRVLARKEGIRTVIEEGTLMAVPGGVHASASAQ